jgi:hypothetical protein
MNAERTQNVPNVTDVNARVIIVPIRVIIGKAATAGVRTYDPATATVKFRNAGKVL